MKNNYYLLKQYLLALILLITTTIIVYSCKKDRKFMPLEAKKELIADAKAYFEEEVLSDNLKLNNDPNFRHNIVKRPDWEKAVTQKISVGDAVIVPISFDGDVFSRPANSNQKNYLSRNSYLMIYKDRGEKMHAEWVTLLPNSVRDAGNRKFSGIAVVENWNGKFNRAFAFNGSGAYMPVYIREAITFDKSSYRRSVTCFEVEHWGSISWADGPPRPHYLGSEIFCSEDGSGSGNEDQGHTYNPVTEEEASPGDYISYYIDCNGDIDGAATIDPNCGCIGGNTGILSCTQDPNDPNNDKPLPCENVSEPNFEDIINVKSPIAQNAISSMLPFYYQQFIKFDENGNLDQSLLESGTNPFPGIPTSDLFDALAYIAKKPDININMYLSSNWKGRTTQDPNGASYTWETQNQNLWGVTIVPGDIPLAGVPVTGDKNTGSIYINNAKNSSKPRLSLIVAHELLGHMYKYLKNEAFQHGDPKFEKWVKSVEDKANINWKLLKKWKSSKLSCPQ